MSVRKYQPQQYTMFYTNPKEILGEDHLCFLVDNLVEHLDLSDLPSKQKTVGAPNYDYRLLVKILFYGYANGTFSSRKLMRSTQENIAYVYLTRQQTPNYRTISDFRKNQSEFLENSFTQIVRAAKGIGMIKLGRVSLDSTKIRANADSGKSYLVKELDEQRQKIQEAIKKGINVEDMEDKIYGRDKAGNELPEDLKDEKKRLEKIKVAMEKAKEEQNKRINLTDHDAKFIKSTGGLKLNYNCQTSVENTSKMIISNEVTNKAADCVHLKPQLEKIKKICRKNPKEIFADSGYYSMDNLIYLEQQKIKGYIPDPEEARNKKDIYKDKPRLFSKKYFRYDSKKDVYICPEGEILRRKTYVPQVQLTLYQAQNCQQCSKHDQCLKQTARNRQVSRHQQEEIKIKMRKRLLTKSGKEKYKERLGTVEPPYGHMKKNLGFKQFFCRGLKAVSTEFNLICIGHNIQKLAKNLVNIEEKNNLYLAFS